MRRNFLNAWGVSRIETQAAKFSSSSNSQRSKPATATTAHTATLSAEPGSRCDEAAPVNVAIAGETGLLEVEPELVDPEPDTPSQPLLLAGEVSPAGETTDETARV